MAASRSGLVTSNRCGVAGTFESNAICRSTRLRSGSPSGATRSSTCQMCTAVHGTGSVASVPNITVGVLPPLTATWATPRSATAAQIRSATHTAARSASRPAPPLTISNRIAAPAFDHSVVVLPGQDRKCRGGQVQPLAPLRRRVDPAGRQDAQQVPVGEDQGVAARVEHPRDHPVGTGGYLVDRLAVLRPVGPDHPAGPFFADLHRRAALVVAVVPLEQVLAHLGVGETG